MGIAEPNEHEITGHTRDQTTQSIAKNTLCIVYDEFYHRQAVFAVWFGFWYLLCVILYLCHTFKHI